MAANRRQRRAAARSGSSGLETNLIAIAKRKQAAGLFAEAAAGYMEVLKINKKNTDAMIGLGLLKLKENDRSGALGFLKKAVRVDPHRAVSRFMLGSALLDDEAYDDAIEQFRHCVRLEPDNVQYLRRLADMWSMVARDSRAAECYERIVAVEPENAEVHNNLGMVYLSENLLEEGIASLRRAVELEPANATWRSNLLLILNYSPTLSRQCLFEEHRKFGFDFSDPIDPPVRLHVPVSEDGQRLRIGFVSPDFRSHSVAYFFEPFLAELDRDAFETFCYAEVKRPDETTARLRSMADHWRLTVGKSDEDVAAEIRGDRIDILIDLAGHTLGNRIPVFARRPAPVQATWVGYPNTTGLPEMDFRITDAISDPEGDADGFATETLIRLPDGFLCYRPDPNAPDPATPPCLSEGFVTFGSFNNPSKINPEIVALWARVMRGVPASRLLLKYRGLQDAAVQDRIAGWFASNGVERKRLTFMGRSESKVEHLGLYSRIDVALDTHPYNGTTTTCEALWMGVPVVSLVGDRHASRVGASLLDQMDLADLAAADEDEFVAIACDLAADRERLIGLHHDLRDRMRASTLMDEKNFARQMEAAFQDMLRLKLPSRVAV